MNATPQTFFADLRTARRVMRAACHSPHTVLQLAVLLEIPGKPDRPILGEIHHRTGMSHQAARACIRALAASGLITTRRTPAPKGGHPNIFAALTDAGSAYLQRFIASMEAGGGKPTA